MQNRNVSKRLHVPRCQPARLLVALGVGLALVAFAPGAWGAVHGQTIPVSDDPGQPQPAPAGPADVKPITALATAVTRPAPAGSRRLCRGERPASPGHRGGGAGRHWIAGPGQSSRRASHRNSGSATRGSAW